MKALADFIGACGFEKPDELIPEIFFKRTKQNLNQSFAELYFKQDKTINRPRLIHNLKKALS